MKKLIYSLVFLLIVIYNIEDCSAQWVQSEIQEGFGRCFAIQGDHIFLGTDIYGVFVSTDNGTKWTQTTLGNQKGRFVYSLAVSGNSIFAGTGGSSPNGIYVSADNGATWTLTGNIVAHSLIVSGSNIYASSKDGMVYKSADNGASWSPHSLEIKGTVFSLTVHGNNIFAGTDDNGVFVSSDEGETWTQTSMNKQYVHCLATLGDNVFAGAHNYPEGTGGVYLSKDDGLTWTQTGLKNNNVYALVTYKNNILAGTDKFLYDSGGVFISKNSGANWIKKNEGFTSTFPQVLSLFVANGEVFAGVSGGKYVWRRAFSEIVGIKTISTDKPASFSLKQNSPNPFTTVTKIVFDVLFTSNVKIAVYDGANQEVQVLVNELLEPGKYETTFDGTSFDGGQYSYQMTTEDPLGQTANFSETKKMFKK